MDKHVRMQGENDCLLQWKHSGIQVHVLQWLRFWKRTASPRLALTTKWHFKCMP